MPPERRFSIRLSKLRDVKRDQQLESGQSRSGRIPTRSQKVMKGIEAKEIFKNLSEFTKKLEDNKVHLSEVDLQAFSKVLQKANNTVDFNLGCYGGIERSIRRKKRRRLSITNTDTPVRKELTQSDKSSEDEDLAEILTSLRKTEDECALRRSKISQDANREEDQTTSSHVTSLFGDSGLDTLNNITRTADFLNETDAFKDVFGSLNVSQDTFCLNDVSVNFNVSFANELLDHCDGGKDERVQ